MQLVIVQQLRRLFRHLGANCYSIAPTRVKTGLAAIIIGVNYSCAAAQTLSTADCRNLRKTIESNFERIDPHTPKYLSADTWVLLEQAAERGCLSESGVAAISENIVQLFKTATTREIEEARSDGIHPTSHMLTLCKTRIATFTHNAALQDYNSFIALLDHKEKLADYHTHKGWLPYSQCVVSAGFAIDKIDESLEIVRAELEKDSKRPLSAQAEFATQVGIMLVSRLRMSDAISFFKISDSLVKAGIKNQLALYWLVLHAHSDGDTQGSRRYLARLKALPNLSDDMRAKVLFLEVLSQPKSRPELKNSEMLPTQASAVLRDLDSLGTPRRPQ